MRNFEGGRFYFNGCMGMIGSFLKLVVGLGLGQRFDGRGHGGGESGNVESV